MNARKIFFSFACSEKVSVSFIRRVQFKAQIIVLGLSLMSTPCVNPCLLLTGHIHSLKPTLGSLLWLCDANGTPRIEAGSIGAHFQPSKQPSRRLTLEHQPTNHPSVSPTNARKKWMCLISSSVFVGHCKLVTRSQNIEIPRFSEVQLENKNFFIWPWEDDICSSLTIIIILIITIIVNNNNNKQQQQQYNDNEKRSIQEATTEGENLAYQVVSNETTVLKKHTLLPTEEHSNQKSESPSTKRQQLETKPRTERGLVIPKMVIASLRP